MKSKTHCFSYLFSLLAGELHLFSVWLCPCQGHEYQFVLKAKTNFLLTTDKASKLAFEKNIINQTLGTVRGKMDPEI